jgi:hypothetical protein
MQKREKGLAMVLAALVLVGFFSAGSAWGQAVYSSWPQQTPPAFVVAPFVDAHTGNGDTSLLITNTGFSYDLCADIYLFNTDGGMIGCCACPVKQNGLLTLSMNDLTQNTLIGAAKTGVVKVVSSTDCSAANPTLYPGLKIYQRSVYPSSGPSPIVPVPDTLLGMFEFQALKGQCAAIQKQSGKNGPGICQCPGGQVGIPQ